MTDDSTYIQRAINEAGCKAQNCIVLLSFAYLTTGGTFTATLNGQTTAAITFPPTAATLKSALEAISSIGVDGANVSGPLGGPYQVEFVGGNAGQEVGELIIDGSDLVPEQQPEVDVLQQGDPAQFQSLAEEFWAENSEAFSTKLRFLRTKLSLIEYRLGRASGNVDVRTGQANETEVKQSQEFDQIMKLWERTQDAILVETRAFNATRRRTSGGVMRAATPNGLPYGVLSRDGCGNING